MGAAEEERQKRLVRRPNNNDVSDSVARQVKDHQATFHAVLAATVPRACAPGRGPESRVRADVQHEDVLPEQCRRHGGIDQQQGRSNGPRKTAGAEGRLVSEY